ELAESDNLFAVVVAAHLRTMETKKDTRKRFRYKVELTKELCRQGMDKSDILNLYLFIDWIMRLPEDLEIAYHREIIKFEEERKMQYITTAERIGIEKGKVTGRKEGMLIGQILMAQRLLGYPVYSRDELESKTLAELEGVFAEVEAKMA
ncbi:hypothetical protein QUF72_08025, partial [Desulfobacterales bacterium HSG2]|nr:hypothetical protein [Desulfobacterales bacterium HSG2]